MQDGHSNELCALIVLFALFSMTSPYQCTNK